MRLSDIASTLQANLHGVDAVVKGFSIDSRNVKSGDVFVALPGERVDGHAYIQSAIDSGAAAALVERKPEQDVSYIVVENCQRALGQIAASNRERFEGQVVGVTGSAGKTSSKNMIASILSQQASTKATQGNYNNEIGLPLTVLEIDASHRYAVLEMGAAKAGDIRYLCGIARPHVAVVTNVGEAHISGFGSLQNTASTKGEIFQSLPEDGVAVINRDDRFAGYWRELVGERPVIEVSLQDENADIYASDIQLGPEGTRFTLNYRSQGAYAQQLVSLAVLGEHNVRNALAAAAVATALQVDAKQIAAGLAAVRPEAGRLQLKKVSDSLLVLDDSYNSNPQAARASVDVLAEFEGEKLVVFGDMKELGEIATEAHRGLGAYAAEMGIAQLFAVGDYAADLCAGFGKGAHSFDTRQQLAQVLRQRFDARTAQKENQTKQFSTIVLVKGSRSAAMDEVVDLLLAARSMPATQGDQPGEVKPC